MATFVNALARISTEADLPGIARIYGHHVERGLASFEEVPPDAAEMERRRAAILGLGLPHLVAEAGGEIVGFAYAGPYRPRSAYRFTVEDSVYVDAGATGRGVGGLLLAALIRDCEARGARQMLAVIGDSGNLGSIRLHARAGFRHAGTLEAVGFKHGRWVDCVLMQRPLGEGDGTLPEG
ncbi:MAG TPA: GNAT family N-acetyltransferase [Amaricoccus sp.]|nr:GNAT family N-acetyltransferase [Amaricoccus sp.]